MRTGDSKSDWRSTPPKHSCQYIDFKGRALKGQGYSHVARALEPPENVVGLSTLGLGGAFALLSSLNTPIVFSAIAAAGGHLVSKANQYFAYRTMHDKNNPTKTFTKTEIEQLAINKSPSGAELEKQNKYRKKINSAKEHFFYESIAFAICHPVIMYALNYNSSHPAAVTLVLTAVLGGPTIAQNLSAFARFKKCEQGEWAVIEKPKPHEVREKQPAHANTEPACPHA